MNIGDRIKELRELKSLSQKAFAEILGIDTSQYSKIERGKMFPTIPQLTEISKYFNLSIDYIITGKECAAPEINYKEGYELALRNIELLNEVQLLKDKVHQLENASAKSRYKAGNENETSLRVAESKSELKKT